MLTVNWQTLAVIAIGISLIYGLCCMARASWEDETMAHIVKWRNALTGATGVYREYKGKPINSQKDAEIVAHRLNQLLPGITHEAGTDGKQTDIGDEAWRNWASKR